MSSDTAATLPTNWYIDADHFGREQHLVWGRNWICIGREEDWPEAHAFRVVKVADQQLVVLRDREENLRAYLNTCRHRGSRLCEADSGRLPGLGPEQQQAGMTFATFWPSMFLVAHVDYVRSVRVAPVGPQRTRLTVEWLLAKETPKLSAAELERLCEFGRQVVLEDARVCVINQQGLNNRRHRGGVLMPNEHGVLEFDNWVRSQLA